MRKASLPFVTVLLLLFPVHTSAQVPAPYPPAQYPPPAQPPPAQQPPGGEARTIDAFQGYQPAQANPSQGAGPGAPARAADKDDSLDGRFGLGTFLKISDGLAGRTGIAMRYWPHRAFGLEADFGFSLWSGEQDGVKQQRQEFAPRLGLLFPVAHGKFTHFFLEVGGGPLLAKEPKEDLGLGLAADAGFGVEILLMRDPHLSLEFKGGGEYFSYKAAGLGNGAGTTFSTGFTYYF